MDMSSKKLLRRMSGLLISTLLMLLEVKGCISKDSSPPSCSSNPIALRHYLTKGDNVTVPVNDDDDDVTQSQQTFIRHVHCKPRLPLYPRLHQLLTTTIQQQFRPHQLHRQLLAFQLLHSHLRLHRSHRVPVLHQFIEITCESGVGEKMVCL